MAHHVELCLAWLRSRVKCNDLSTEKVIAWSDARGHREILPATTGNHTVNTPIAGAV